MKRLVHLGLLFYLFGASRFFFADANVLAAEPSRASGQVKKHKKGNIKSEKEAEGTQAPTRISADSVVKSVYEQSGQVLEVDPD